MLDQLNPIIQPESVSMRPELLPGWIVVIVLLLAALTLVVLWRMRTHRKNRYRRDGLAELEQVVRDSSGNAPGDAERIRTISRLLKRVALVAYPRKDVASLTGPEWSSFLDKSAGRKGFSESSMSLMRAASYQAGGSVEEATQSEGLDRLIKDARNWIGNHHV
jgi:Domain of unknown function (DUF4381)